MGRSDAEIFAKHQSDQASQFTVGIKLAITSATHATFVIERKGKSMEYFFLLVLEYEIRGQTMTSRWILPSSEACQVAIRENEGLATYLNANLYCQKTDVLSKSIRPKLRPEKS